MRATAKPFVPLLGLLLAGSAGAVPLRSDGFEPDAASAGSSVLEASDSQDYPGVLIPILFPVTWDASRVEVLSLDAADYEQAGLLTPRPDDSGPRVVLQGVTITLP